MEIFRRITFDFNDEQLRVIEAAKKDYEEKI